MMSDATETVPVEPENPDDKLMGQAAQAVINTLYEMSIARYTASKLRGTRGVSSGDMFEAATKHRAAEQQFKEAVENFCNTSDMISTKLEKSGA